MKKKVVSVIMFAFLSTLCLSSCSNSEAALFSINSAVPESSVESKKDNSEDNSITETKENNWKIQYGVDEFGDATSTGYISYLAEGTFSNSATTNSLLYVNVLVTNESDLLFTLFEYGSSKVINTYSRLAEYEINYKLENGKTGKVYGAMANNDGTYLIYVPGKSGYDSLDYISEFKKNQTIKFMITPIDRPSTKYNFSIDTTGFEETFNNFQ